MNDTSSFGLNFRFAQSEKGGALQISAGDTGHLINLYFSFLGNKFVLISFSGLLIWKITAV